MLLELLWKTRTITLSDHSLLLNVFEFSLEVSEGMRSLSIRILSHTVDFHDIRYSYLRTFDLDKLR